MKHKGWLSIGEAGPFAFEVRNDATPMVALATGCHAANNYLAP